MRWIWFPLRLFARFCALIAAKAVLILAVAAISLSFSLASFAIPMLGSAMWSAAAWVTGLAPVVTPPSETQRLRSENRSLRERNQNLQQTNRQRAQANRVLSDANRHLNTRNTELRGQISNMRTTAAERARRIGQRAVRTTTRSVAAIPLESVPILGISTIIATTAWEIRDVCRTLEDMAAIQDVIYGDNTRETETSFAEQACDMAPLWRERGDHYGDMTISECREEAEGARDRIYNLARQARDEVPDLIDMTEEFDDEVTQAANAEYEAIIEICDCIVNLDCDPAEDVAH